MLLCGSCGSPIQRGNLMQESYGAYGQPAGYYAGRAEPFGGANAAEFTAWVAKNQAGIDEVQRRITEIRDGKRTPGCIGQDKYTCVATLAQKMAIADQYFLKDTNVFAEPRYDVNGRALNGSTIMFDGYGANAKGDYVRDHTVFSMKLDPQGTVVSMVAKLPKQLARARTQEEYDATRAYETVSAVTADACKALGRDEVARWIENSIKPSSQFTPTKHWKDEGDQVTSRDLESKKMSLCGRSFMFHTIEQTVRHGFQSETTVETLIEID